MSSECGHDRVFKGVEEMVPPDHTALVVVDVQNDFGHSDGFIAKFGLDMSYIQAALPRVNDAIRNARRLGVRVIYLQEWISKATILPNFISQFGDFENIAVRENTWGAEFHPDLVKPEAGELNVRKPCYDRFHDTHLDVSLRGLGRPTRVYARFASHGFL